MTELEQSEGYLKLRKAVDRDKAQGKFHDYEAKFQWVLDRVAHYAEKTGIDAGSILDAWESKRDYWYMNYYQDAEQPLLTADSVRVFDTAEDLAASVGKHGFRCPSCNSVSSDAYACNSGVIGTDGKACNWKVYGLFRALGKGAFVFVKDQMRGQNIFMPIAWEQKS